MTGNTRDAKRAETAARILRAAREEFASRGFEGATIRSIADRAAVHASLVMQHYGSKAALFASAVELPDGDSDSVSGHLFDVLNGRLSGLAPETRALVRSMLTSPEAEASMRDFLEERIENLTGSLTGPLPAGEAEVRATLAVSSILGLTIARHFLKLPAFDRIPPDALLHAASGWMDTVAGGGTDTVAGGSAEPEADDSGGTDAAGAAGAGADAGEGATSSAVADADDAQDAGSGAGRADGARV